ncbi:MAG TPA: fluoride efflux transporter CrcB [Fimbriimonadaceae bacterium]|jgi:CrcB protein
METSALSLFLDSPLGKVLLVGCGGFLGANARYWLGGMISGRVSPGFPWGTFIINVTGSFVIGIIMASIIGFNWGRPWQLLLVTGILGGYTTFSSFSYESIQLVLGRSYLYAAYYIFGSVILSLVGTMLGIIVARLLGAREV